MARHNELRDRVKNLPGKAFTPSHVRNDPHIFTGCAMKRPKAKLPMYKGTIVPYDTLLIKATEQKSDLLIRNLCQNGTDSFHGMRVVNKDDKSHSAKTPEKYLDKVQDSLWNKSSV